MRIVRLTRGRLAVLDHTPAGEELLLTVPTMHPQTAPAVRTQVFELVMRRLYGEALELAQATNDEIARRTPEANELATMLAETPHRSVRGAVAA
jgi:hypothetical protein